MTHDSNQPVVITKRRSGFGNGLGLALSLLLLVLPGIATLGFAEKHKPTLSNVFANGGDVLTPSAYQGVHALALLMLVGGGVIALVCLVRMASRPGVAPAPQYASPPAHPRQPASTMATERPFSPPAPEARQP